MMNKVKSSALHLPKFLFVLPLMAVLLLAFRNTTNTMVTTASPAPMLSVMRTDTVPAPSIGTVRFSAAPTAVSEKNDKGYIVTVADNAGECIVLVRNKKMEFVKAISLVDWNSDKKRYESKFGAPAPPPPTVTVTAYPSFRAEGVNIAAEPATTTTVASDPVAKTTVTTDPVVSVRTGDMTMTAPQVEVVTSSAAATEPSVIVSSVTPDVEPLPIVVEVSDMLVIIDGVEKKIKRKGDLGVDSKDIETMSVWKGKEATDKYGEKGKNGVIEIITKKKSGKK